MPEVLLQSRKISRYGWKPALPDVNKPRFCRAFNIVGASALPTTVDLRPHDNPIYDQETLGSCTSNSTAGMVEFVQKKEGKPHYCLSRLWHYWNERYLEGGVANTKVDSGASLADAVKVISTLGCPHESLWWYNVAKFSVKPNQKVFTDALPVLASGVSSLDTGTIDEMKTCLASGFPFVFGVTVYDSFESDSAAKTGLIPMPGEHENVLGGHALMAVGYVDNAAIEGGGHVIFRNSWGKDWGIAGTGLIPYAYLADGNLADDFWTIRQVG